MRINGRRNSGPRLSMAQKNFNTLSKGLKIMESSDSINRGNAFKINNKADIIHLEY